MADEQKTEALSQVYNIEDTGYEPELDSLSVPLKPEPESKQNPPVEPAQPAKPAAPAHSRRLVEMAMDYGVDAEEIAGLTPSELENLVYHLHRQHASLAREHTRTETAAAVAPTPEPAFEVDEELVAPEIAALFRQQQEEIKALRAELNEQKKFRQQAQETENRSVVQQINAGFKATTNPALFGNGSPKAGSIEMQRCQGVLASLDSHPIRGLSIADQVAQRADELFGAGQANPQKPSAEPVIEQRKQQWQNGALQAPTPRVPPVQKGERAAVRVAAEKMREFGLGDDDDELSGFLD